MIYNFPTFKFYIFGLLVLFLLFIVAWLPSAEIKLTSIAEPLLLDFEVNLIQSAKKPLPNLGIISSKVINLNSEEIDPGYVLIDELKSDKEEKILVFLREDLQKIAEYKAKNILDNFPKTENSGDGFIPFKKVLNFHPIKWNIQVINKDLERGSATLLISMKEEVFMNYDLKILKENIISRELAETNEILIKLPGMKNVKINSWPKFWHYLPLFSSRIKIIIN